jgi:hypothetical protein
VIGGKRARLWGDLIAHWLIHKSHLIGDDIPVNGLYQQQNIAMMVMVVMMKKVCKVIAKSYELSCIVVSDYYLFSINIVYRARFARVCI